MNPAEIDILSFIEKPRVLAMTVGLIRSEAVADLPPPD